MIFIDYAGHAFTYELARTIAERRDGVAYAWCATVVMPHGVLEPTDTLDVEPLGSGWTFDKYSTRGRLLSEMRLGVAAARMVWRRGRTDVVTANMPVLSLAFVWMACVLRRSRLLVWFQDSQAGLVANLGGAASWAGRPLGMLEGFLLRRARRVVAISEGMVDEARRFGVREQRLRLLENWAPIEEIPVLGKDNDWAQRHGLVDRFCFVYSGTLARKHNPALMVRLAEAVRDDPDVSVVVVSESEGAGLVASEADRLGLEHVLVLPYQDFADLPMVLATADVLCVVLEKGASRFSVPSKVLSYLCAARPIVGSIPADNLAAVIVRDRAQAGVVVDPDDDDGFVAAALALRRDADRRSSLGASGRAYAERTFGRDSAADRFLSAVEE